MKSGGRISWGSLGQVFAAVGLTAVVAGCAGAISFNALRVLAVSVFVPEVTAPLYPIVDGMLGVATLAAVMHRSSRLRTRAYIWRLIGAAIAVSVAGNALHTTGHGGDVHLPLLAAAAVSAVPAASLAAALHLLVIVTRSPAAMALDIRAIRTTASMADTRHADSIRPGRTARARVDRLVKRHGADISAAEVARRTGLSERHAARVLSDIRRPRVMTEEKAVGDDS